MKPIPLPDSYNYIGVFLTFDCNQNCSYCLNNTYGVPTPGRLGATDWISALNRLRARPDLPITLQGGEPSLLPGFLDLLAAIKSELPIDILTNLQFDIDAFVSRIRPERLKRDAPYASIRVSYHPGSMDLRKTIDHVRRLMDGGYSIGVWGILHPDWLEHMQDAEGRFRKAGIDFRTKEFLGFHKGRLYGTYGFSDACDGPKRNVLCRTSELLIDPGARVFHCHHDLYRGVNPLGSLLDSDFGIEDRFRPCDCCGQCHPCDIKVKTNRFQEYGHTAVEIRRNAELP